ncbi:carbohydrate kinase family protein [Thermosipho atlanticus]|uniref:Ribokinase n=1 Tax=Thermosipho atlanticus DSM 15807 TaxID=1123380 RepID=A0A1M5U527_9BACT|nr:carbohydrate kinase family protein [Thermosipho atlanticus]SHH58074.1 ribokinase [Thermosipho atlanticus DSM 15807]
MFYNEEKQLEKFDIYCIGKTNLDIFYYVNSIKLEENHIANEFYYYVGGKATNVAINLSNLGLKVALISVIGKDIFGNKILEILKNKNITFLGKTIEEDTAITSIIVDKNGKNTMFHNLGANSKFSPDLIPDKLDFSFIQSGIDCNSIIKTIDASKNVFLELSETSQFEKLKYHLKKIKYVSLNEHEINSIFRTNNTEKNLELLSKFANNILLKVGEKGLIYLDEHGKLYTIPAKKINVKNSTGAGDATSAAFIYGILKNWHIEKVLSFCIEYSTQILRSKFST